VLLPKSFSSLDDVVGILKNDPNRKLNIDGHTDHVGDSIKNQILSEQRAGAVLKYVSEKGISQTHLNAEGFGEGRPIVENNTSSGRATNRRVELRLLY
jgi:OOP family OmpA-OmpF porin